MRISEQSHLALGINRLSCSAYLVDSNDSAPHSNYPLGNSKTRSLSISYGRGKQTHCTTFIKSIQELGAHARPNGRRTLPVRAAADSEIRKTPTGLYSHFFSPNTSRTPVELQGACHPEMNPNGKASRNNPSPLISCGP